MWQFICIKTLLQLNGSVCILWVGNETKRIIIHGMEIVQFVPLRYAYLLAVLHALRSLFRVLLTAVTSLTHKISITYRLFVTETKKYAFRAAETRA
jgi:hypothetical protein